MAAEALEEASEAEAAAAENAEHALQAQAHALSLERRHRQAERRHCRRLAAEAKRMDHHQASASDLHGAPRGTNATRGQIHIPSKSQWGVLTPRHPRRAAGLQQPWPSKPQQPASPSHEHEPEPWIDSAPELPLAQQLMAAEQNVAQAMNDLIAARTRYAQRQGALAPFMAAGAMRAEHQAIRV